MSDFMTMVWKEAKDTIFSGGRGELFRPLLVIVILGIILPWQFGQSWISLSAPVIFVVSYIPFFLVTSYIGDAVAGERERHTLETLLASRISDRAILWGKMLVTIVFVWILTVVGLLLGLLVANLLSGQGHWSFYHPISILLELLLLGLLTGTLSTSGGVLISLRTATVRQAQQTMAVGTLVLMIALILILKAIPAGFLSTLNVSQFFLFFIGGLVVVDLILVGILTASFRRSRLILS